MYNRYIPQQDGSYRKNRIPEQKPPAPTSIPPAPCSPPPSRTGASAEGFLRQLLPKNLDTGDLLIVILLLYGGRLNKADARKTCSGKNGNKEYYGIVRIYGNGGFERVRIVQQLKINECLGDAEGRSKQRSYCRTKRV